MWNGSKVCVLAHADCSVVTLTRRGFWKLASVLRGGLFLTGGVASAMALYYAREFLGVFVQE